MTLARAGQILVLLSLVFLGVNLYNHAGEIPPVQWTLVAFSTIVFSTVCLAAYSVLLTCAWRLLLPGGSTGLTVSQAYVIIGKSQIAKYLPGNVFHYVGRVTLASRYGIPAQAVIVSIAAETLIIMLTAGVMVFVGWNKLGSHFFSIDVPSSRATLLFGAGVVLTAVFLLLSGSARRWVLARIAYLSPGRFAASFALYAIYFLIMGGTVYAFCRNVWHIELVPDYFFITSAYAAAWVLGFVVPGASGGIGIREAVFVGLFGGQVGQGAAVGLAALLRVVTIASDLTTFAAASWLGRHQLKPSVL